MGKPVSAGVYLYQIQAREFVQTKRLGYWTYMLCEGLIPLLYKSDCLDKYISCPAAKQLFNLSKTAWASSSPYFCNNGGPILYIAPSIYGSAMNKNVQVESLFIWVGLRTLKVFNDFLEIGAKRRKF